MELLTGTGHPSKRLKGEVGQHYKDLNTGDIYECKVAKEHSPMHGKISGGYIWHKIATGDHVEIMDAKLDKELYDTSYVDTLSWDGSTTGRTTYTNSYDLQSGGMVLGNVSTTYVKVSDFIPDVDTFKLNPYSNMQYETGKDPVSKEYKAGSLVVERAGYYTIAGENIMIVHSSNAEFEDAVRGTVILEPGIYYSIVTTTMTIAGNTVTETRSSELKAATEIFPVKKRKGGSGGGWDAWDFVLEAQGDISDPVNPTVTPWRFAKGTFSDMWKINESEVPPRVCVHYCYMLEGELAHSWYYPSLINHGDGQIDIYIGTASNGGSSDWYYVNLFDNGDIVSGKLS